MFPTTRRLSAAVAAAFAASVLGAAVFAYRTSSAAPSAAEPPRCP